MTVNEENVANVRSKSLLEKYDIPIDHLDFKYLGTCTNVKEVERIIRILRSGEEGHYPDLLSCAEEKLRELAPNSTLLRVLTPVLNKNSLDPKEWNSVIEDIEVWQDEVGLMEKSLNKGIKTVEPLSKSYPSIRKSKKMAENVSVKKEKKEDKIKSFDYDKWDKYDAEGECTKLDIEDEVKREERERREREEAKRRARELALEEEERIIEEIKNNISTMTEGEKKVYALKEKDLGNDFYKTNDLEKALKHYTRSITIHPMAVAYNNRAATYLKQCKYSKALEDTNIVLEMDPNNVKAYYRRALSLQHKNEFHKALDDIRQVLKREPNHVVARHIADQLREHCNEMPRKCKLMLKDESNDDPDSMKVIEVTEDEMLRDYKDKDFVEVNDWGLPKIMCNCNGKYTNDPGIRHDHRVRFQHLNNRAEKKTTPPPPREMFKPSGGGAEGGKIEEVAPIAKQNTSRIEFGQGDRHSGKSKRLEIMELERIAEEITGGGVNRKASPRERVRVNRGDNNRIDTNKILSDSQESEKKQNFTGLFGPIKEETTPEELRPVEETEEEEEEEVEKVAKDERITEKLHNNQKTEEVKDEEGKHEEEMEVEEASGEDEENLGVANKKMKGGEDAAVGGEEEGAPKNKIEERKLREKTRQEYDQRMFQEMTYEEDLGASPGPPIQVAKKYREKVSRPKVCQQLPTDTPKQELPREVHNNCSSSTDQSLSPMSFCQSWTDLLKNKGSFEERARLLRSVRPHLLQAVVGNKLDDEMLSNFLYCLHNHFSVQSETELIIEYLTAIMELKRFNIIYSFLSTQDRTNVHELLEMLGPSANQLLHQAYH